MDPLLTVSNFDFPLNVPGCLFVVRILAQAGLKSSRNEFFPGEWESFEEIVFYRIGFFYGALKKHGFDRSAHKLISLQVRSKMKEANGIPPQYRFVSIIDCRVAGGGLGAWAVLVLFGKKAYHYSNGLEGHRINSGLGS